MMSHSQSAVMLFAEMDQPVEGPSIYDSGLGSLPKDSLGLDLSQFEHINDDDPLSDFNLLHDEAEEGRNGSGVGVDEFRQVAAADVDCDSIGSDVLNWAVQSMAHDMSGDHDYQCKPVVEYIDSNAENDADESPVKSGDVSSPRRVVTRSERPKRSATLKKRAVSICSDSSEEMESSKTRQTSADRSMSKNAIAARENREKKKQYVTNLEKELKKCKVESAEKDRLLGTYQQRSRSPRHRSSIPAWLLG